MDIIFYNAIGIYYLLRILSRCGLIWLRFIVTSEWLEEFGGIVPAAPILNLKESLENPFLKDRKNIQKLKTKRGINISLLKTPVHVSGGDFQDKTAPELGEDTDDVLKEVGFTGEQISSFRHKGII